MRASLLVPYKAGQPNRDAAWDWVRARLEQLHPEFEIVLGTDEAEPFARGTALNDAEARATGDVLVLYDADSIVSHEQLQWAAALAVEHRGMVLAFERFYYLSELGTQELLRRPVDTWAAEPPQYEWSRDTSVGGIQAVSRRVWDEVGGFDERFHGWGFEDNTLAYAIQTLVGPIVRVPGDMWHLWHPLAATASPETPSYKANAVLCDRYGAACGDPAAMRALIDERADAH